LLNFDQAPWITMHQVGNRRDHTVNWHLAEIYNECAPPRPALNGEPYYAGWPPHLAAAGGSEEDDMNCRAAMYGSFLSGGLAGHIYGADGLWGGDIEPGALTRMWESIQWGSGAQLQHLRAFALSEGHRYQDLVPNAEWVTPNKSVPACGCSSSAGSRGWAFCARTPERDLFMLYFEAGCPQAGCPQAGCPQAAVRGALPDRAYRAQWFNPRTGEWSDAGQWAANQRSYIDLPACPSTQDWGLKLVLAE